MDLKKPELIGELHNNISEKILKTFVVQHDKGISNGIKGFILHGPPGTGKTTIAQHVIYTLAYKHSKLHLDKDLVYKLLNLADIAKARFGETEGIIKETFKRSIEIAKQNDVFFILVMDDVDGMFPSRSYGKLDAWYLGHLNVLFTALDECETDKIGVIMTTNRKDLLDDAVISRLVDFEVPFIDINTAKSKINSLITELKMGNEYEKIILDKIKEKVDKKLITNLSFRDVEKEVILEYSNWIDEQSL